MTEPAAAAPRLISFDPLRTLDLDVTTVKPEDWLKRQDEIRAADWLLFPEYWQVNALVYAWHKRIFPGAASFHLGHDKIEMTRAFQAAFPAHTPHTLILPPTPASVDRVLDELTLPLVVKEPRNSMGRGVRLIRSHAELADYLRQVDVLYAQELLPIRRDLRVVIVGDTVVHAYWREAPEGGFHNNVAQGGRIDETGVPESGTAFALRVARALGIDHAGFDLAEVDGHWYLLEFNVRFGTQGLAEKGIRIGDAILSYLNRA